MSRPRKATVDSHIAGYTLPRFTGADWEDLERIARVQLDDAARAEIQDAADQYTEESLLQHDGAARAGMVGQATAGLNQQKKALPLAIFKKSLQKLIVAWREADLDPETARLLADFAAETKQRSKGTLDLERAMVDLETMDHCLRLFLDRMANGIVPIDGASARKAPPARRNRPSLGDPFNSLVGRLAEIFAAAGGKVTAPTWTENSKRVSSFVAFVMRVNGSFRDDVKQNHATDAAWSKAVALALRG